MKGQQNQTETEVKGVEEQIEPLLSESKKVVAFYDYLLSQDVQNLDLTLGYIHRLKSSDSVKNYISKEKN